MPIVQAVRSFVWKENYDFNRPDINLYNFHPQLRLFFSMKGIFFNNQNSFIRYIWPVMSILLALIANSFEALFVHHGLTTGDYEFATECFCYFLMLGVIVVVYTSVLMHKKEILQIVQEMNSDFLYICTLGSRYKNTFLEGQLLIWKLCFAWLGFVGVIACMYIGMPVSLLLYQSLFATLDEHMVRPLIFPMWLPEDDPYRTPNYEIFFTFETIFCMIFIQTFCVYVYIQFHVLLHNYNLMDLIILDFGVLFDGLDESVVELPRNDLRRVMVQQILNRRLKRIVTWHISVFDSLHKFSTVYGPTLVYQVLLSSIAICFIGYQIAEKLDNGVVDFLFMMLLIGACIQLWIPCYLGTMIRNKAFAIGDACWSCGWQETPLGRMIKTDIIIVILRTQKPLTIQFTGLPTLQLETFSSVMSTAYSYFNMLRQYG